MDHRTTTQQEKKFPFLKQNFAEALKFLDVIFYLYNYQPRLKGNIPNSLKQKVLTPFYSEYTEATCKMFQDTTSKKIF